MRCMSPESTGLMALKLTIPQIPHINLSFLLSAFDEDAVFPETNLDVRNYVRAFKNRLPRVSERIGVHGQESPKDSLLHSHPEEFTAHEVVVELQISVFIGHHCDIVVIANSNCSSNRMPGVCFQPTRLDWLGTRHQEGHHGYGRIAVN